MLFLVVKLRRMFTELAVVCYIGNWGCLFPKHTLSYPTGCLTEALI